MGCGHPAIAAIIFGNRRILSTAAVSLLFGFAKLKQYFKIY
jgi:ABC-type uncharacterized transport system permease subunit